MLHCPWDEKHAEYAVYMGNGNCSCTLSPIRSQLRLTEDQGHGISLESARNGV